MRRTWIAASLVVASIGCGGLIEPNDPNVTPVPAPDGGELPPDSGEIFETPPPPFDGGITDPDSGEVWMKDDGGVVPPPDASPPPGFDAGPPPPTGHCTSLFVGNDGSVDLATLDVGGAFATSHGPAITIANAASIGSIGEHDQKLYACNGHVLEIDPSGAVSTFDVTCGAVTADASSIWVDSAERGLERFDGIASVVAGAPLATFPSTGSSRISVLGDVLIAAFDKPGAHTDVRRIDTANGTTSTSTQNVSGVLNTGLSLADSGFYAVYAPNWRGRFSSDGSLQFVSGGGASTGTFHGLVCH
jgi:hypothetical protein